MTHLPWMETGTFSELLSSILLVLAITLGNFTLQSPWSEYQLMSNENINNHISESQSSFCFCDPNVTSACKATSAVQNSLQIKH